MILRDLATCLEDCHRVRKCRSSKRAARCRFIRRMSRLILDMQARCWRPSRAKVSANSEVEIHAWWAPTNQPIWTLKTWHPLMLPTKFENKLEPSILDLRPPSQRNRPLEEINTTQELTSQKQITRVSSFGTLKLSNKKLRVHISSQGRICWLTFLLRATLIQLFISQSFEI